MPTGMEVEFEWSIVEKPVLLRWTKQMSDQSDNRLRLSM